jgi:Domain of unknown function (DUF1844)
MAQRKEDAGFTVTDRRLFTTEGDLRSDVAEEKKEAASTPTAVAPPPTSSPSEKAPEASGDSKVPPPPTAAEQKASNDAYRQSSKDLDARVELSGHSAKEFEITFERFMASLYMSGMMQMGMMHEEGAQPRVDLIGARQTIDTLGLLQTKTKGNLTPTEDHFLQNCLYELRMAYVEVTNALARPPQAPGPAAGSKTR